MVGVVAVREQRAAAARVPVDTSGYADGEAAQPPGERGPVGGLDEEVDVIGPCP